MNIYSHNSKGFDRLGVNDKKQDTNVIINAICFAVFSSVEIPFKVLLIELLIFFVYF